jgi:hypothetical protein
VYWRKILRFSCRQKGLVAMICLRGPGLAYREHDRSAMICLRGPGLAYREHDRIADEELGRAAAGGADRAGARVPPVVPCRGGCGLAVQVCREGVAELDAGRVRAELGGL